MNGSARRLAWFVAVGCVAALVHLGVVVILVTRMRQLPLVANVIGWLIAFCFSFSGHWLLTFRALQAPLWRAAARFFGVSLAGFAANELAYALLLRWTGLRYDLLLALVLVAVAVMTYLLSLRWAFQGRRAPRGPRSPRP
jgi:putative flippase GtrA